MLIILLLLPVFMHAQTPAGNQRQLVSLAIKYEPDQMEEANKYYVVVNKPACVLLKDNQTFLVQSTWQNQGDSVTGIGAGTVQEINDSSAELVVTVYRGKKIKKGDMALFLVLLDKPLVDTIFFKMARLCINFTTVYDSIFYNCN